MGCTLKRWVCATLLVLASFALAAPVGATQVFWALQAFTFTAADGGSADGYFVFDAANQEILAWDISVSAGVAPYTAFRYQSGLPDHTANLTSTGTIRLWFRNPSLEGGRELFFFHAATDGSTQNGPLPDAGGVYILKGGGFGEVVTVAAGSKVRSTGEPEPLRGKLLSEVTQGDVIGAGSRLGPVSQSGDPVNLELGSFTYNALLLAAPSSSQPFQFEIFYDSSAAPGSGSVGRKWTHSYEWRLEEYTIAPSGQLTGIASPGSATPARLRVVRGDRAADYFEARLAGGITTYVATFPQTRAKLERNGDGTFTYTDPERSRYTFDATGRLTAIADRNGQTANLSYGGNGRLASFTGPAPASRVATFAYDANNRMQSVDYQSGLMRVALTYDSAGNLASFSSPTNPALKTRFTYDGAGNLLTGTAGTGPADDVRFVKNTYASGLVVSQLDANGGETKFAYGPSGVTVTDPRGSVSTRTFDEAGRIVGATNEGGASFSWNYDTKGNLTRVQGPRGGRTMSFDPNTGNLMGMVLENGNSLGLIWNANSVLTGIVDSNGNLWGYTYDASGNLAGFTNPVNQGTSYQHDANGRLIKATDATGIVTTRQYDATGELKTVSTATGAISFGYDAMGRANSVTDQSNRTTSFSFDAAGAVSSITDATGQTTTLANDAFGRPMKEVAPDGRSVTYSRDPMGQITATTDAMGRRFEYGYDPAGRMTSKKDPLDAQTRYAYRASGELEKTTDAMGGTASATFTGAGQKQSVTDPNGNTTRFEYDQLGRVTAEVDPLSRRAQTIFDPAGSIFQITNARAQTITYEHDDAGSLITARLPGDTIAFTLNPEGKRISAKHAAGTINTVYNNALGRVSTRTDELGSVIGYQYDAVGNLTTLTYSDGKKVTYTYDAANRMKTVQDWAGRTTTYTYNVGGSLVKTDLPDGSSVAYTYDAGGHLTEMTDKTGAGATIFSGKYSYDAAGRTKSAELSLPLEPALSPQTTVLAYDAANQIKTVDGVAFAFDADGNLTSGTIEGVPTTLVYDALNRLLQRNGDRYRYDADNFRIETIRGGVTTRYVWDGTSVMPRLLEERDSAGAVIARYVHGVGLVGRENAATGAVAVYHFDQRGNTVALTSPAGVITDRYAYDPYGMVVARQGSTPNPFTYGGRSGVFDDGNGFYYMMSRFYVPSLGRFAQQESIYRGSLMRPQSLNRYAFVEGNPVDRIDPRGECWTCVFAGVGAVVGATTKIVSNVIEKKPFYQGVAGAALEGAITGAAASLGPLGQVAAGAAGAAAGQALNQAIGDKYGGEGDSFDLSKIAQEAVIGGVTAGVAGKFFPKSASPVDLVKNLPNLAVGYSGLSAAEKVWVQANLRKFAQGELKDAVIAGIRDGVADIIKGKLGRTGENNKIRAQVTPAALWGLDRYVNPGGSYLINQAPGVVPGNPQ